jgi:hypothetical protein
MLRKILSFLGTRVGLALTLAILVIGVAIVVKQREVAPEGDKSATALAVEKIVKKSLEDDTDGDGLKNWEEALYKTDPENADTDTDGMSDGSEISTNRDPLVSGVGDRTTQSATSTQITFTATDRFSQELFVQYLNAKQSGQEITSEFSDKLAEEILSKNYSSQEKVFDVSELTLIQNPTTSEIRDYGNAFGKAVTVPVPKNVRNELVILDSIQTIGMTDDDEAELRALYNRYSVMRDTLANMRVPADIRNTHATFIRGVDTMRNVVVGIQNLNIDPIGALQKITLYEDGFNSLSVTSVALRQYFVSKNISFSSTESGAVLMR